MIFFSRLESVMAMKKRITITDIAKAVGTSVTTVSFILNGKAKERRISDTVNKRVLEYVKRVGYKPSQLVRNAPGGQTKVLALLADDINNTFVSEVGRHIERIASGLGYHMVYCNTGNDTRQINQFVRLCIDKEIDGVFLMPSDDLEETILKIKKQRIPVVFFDRFISTLDVPYVISDNRQGAYEATKYLSEIGGRRVGLVSLYSNQTQMRARLDGYMDAMDELQQQSFIRKLNVDGPGDEVGEQIVSFIVDNKLDAILFASHYLAIDGLKAMKGKTNVFPQIATFDDHVLFELHTPAISVVIQDGKAVATELMQIMITEIDGNLRGEYKVVVPCTLLVREAPTS